MYIIKTLFFKGGTEWDHFKRHLAIRIPLIMASAVQIAAKMSHASESIKASVIQRVLQIRGSNYSIEEINQSECEVLKNLGNSLKLHIDHSLICL